MTNETYLRYPPLSKVSRDKMENLKRLKERRKYPRFPIGLPLEYREKNGPVSGAIVANLSEGGLLIYSIQDMSIGTDIKIRVFFANEYELDYFEADAKIVWKGRHSETDWRGYKYALEFVEISGEGRRKLVKLINSHLSLDDISDGLKTGRLSLSSLFP